MPDDILSAALTELAAGAGVTVAKHGNRSAPYYGEGRRAAWCSFGVDSRRTARETVVLAGSVVEPA